MEIKLFAHELRGFKLCFVNLCEGIIISPVWFLTTEPKAFISHDNSRKFDLVNTMIKFSLARLSFETNHCGSVNLTPCAWNSSMTRVSLICKRRIAGKINQAPRRVIIIQWFKRLYCTFCLAYLQQCVWSADCNVWPNTNDPADSS